MRPQRNQNPAMVLRASVENVFIFLKSHFYQEKLRERPAHVWFSLVV